MAYRLILTLAFTLMASSALAAPPIESPQELPAGKSRAIDNSSFIDANKILMFVTNHGNFGRDLSGVFGYDYGTFFPFVDTALIRNGSLINSPLYAAGLWVGGIDSATGQTRVTVAEYSDEYVPGPMAGGTFLPDNSNFKVYKLYRDSLAGNPNYDYLHWPAGQGAPVDPLGHPIMLGNQMLWSVYNDADPSQHTNNSGQTSPLGIEVQQTVWASDKNGSNLIPLKNFLDINHLGNSRVTVSALITDPLALTGNDYMVVIDTLNDSSQVWSLINQTTGQVMISSQTNFSGDDNYPIFDGFRVIVTDSSTLFSKFEVVANANGPLDPPEGAASQGLGFPSELPTSRQQVGGARWFFHTADDGGSCGGGTRGSYDAFISRVTRDGQNLASIGRQDYEMRFTGSYDNPGVGGSYAIEAFDGYTVLWVPFELWRIGNGTPDDPNDDIRMIPWLVDDGNDDTYNLESWGCINDIFGGDGEHSVSNGDDDPFTDWVYWYLPSDSSPGQAGYQKAVIKMLNGTYELSDREILARTVLVNWNGGVQPPFNQSLPEEGTIFRITTDKGPQPDSFSFTAATEILSCGNEGLSIYIKYKIFNKGYSIINNCYLSFWSDPDLGGASDDFVGTDTSNNIFFCYNANNNDQYYGPVPPAIGFKLIYGPAVPSAGDSAIFDGSLITDYKNLGMTASARFINGTDPDNAWESYFYMQGLDKYGSLNPNGTKFMFPGDPVLGLGDLDSSSSDRRMTAGCGPFDFRPGDSQYVLVKMAVGLGTDRLSSITKLKEILNYSSDFCIDLDASGKVNMLDITYLINFLYKGGLAPIAPSTADANGDGKVNMIDITYIIRYLYKGGPPPNCR